VDHGGTDEIPSTVGGPGAWYVACFDLVGTTAMATARFTTAHTPRSLLALAALALAPSVALAEDADAARIAAAGHSLKWNWTPPGRSDRYGHAETLIHAPLPTVRTRVLDFAHYRDIVPDKFKTSRVVGHGADGSTDVYIQIVVLHGVLTLWDVTRFMPPRTVESGVDVIEGRMVAGKGNVEDLDVVWTLRSLDEQWTFLKLDLLLKPGWPAPQYAVDEELRDSAMAAVDAIHDRAQGSHGIAAWRGSSGSM
jgi:hypothetical protein